MPAASKGMSDIRKVEDQQFYYGRWKTDAGTVLARHGANTTDLFSEERHGSLEGEKLKRIGLTAD